MINEFNQIYKAEAVHVWNCLHRLGVDERDLEDKVHDVFVTYYRKADSFDKTVPVRAWLCGIAVKVAAAHRRKAYRKRETLCDGDRLMDMPQSDASKLEYDPEAQLSQKETRTIIRRALSRLNENQRNVFVLHDMEQYSIPDIAKIIDLPINTLYSQLRHARKKFASALEKMSSAGGER